jgi:hypothetical protein
MNMSKSPLKEVEALGTVLAAVQDLDAVQRQWVFSSAMSNLGIEVQRSSHAGGQVPNVGEGGIKGSASSARTPVSIKEGLTPKEFLRTKNPQSDVQRMACLGYYLNLQRGQSHFKTKELTALNQEAAGTPIGNPAQAVANATKQSHYLAPAGGGKKQITAFGEEVVDALPDQAAVKEVEKNKPKKRIRRRKGSKA